MKTTALSIAQDAARDYLAAAEKYDGDDLNRESDRIRAKHALGAGICGIGSDEIDQIFDDVDQSGSPADVCRAVLALKEPTAAEIAQHWNDLEASWTLRPGEYE